MTKPTSFRLAVNHLKSLGIIKRDNELLPVLGMTSKGALAAYIGGTAPKHIIDKFLEKYREHVAHFFEDTTQHHVLNAEPGAYSITDKYTKLLEEQLAFLKEQIRADLSTVKTGLTGISGDITYARATQRAILEFQLMKESKGDQKKVEFAKEQINKLIYLQLTGGEQEDNESVLSKQSRT
jgi:hypothetical protein